MKLRRVFLAAVAAIMVTCPAFPAQDRAGSPQQTGHVVGFSAKDGLQDKNVMDMVQDADGTMWLATWSGLYQYDGYTFRNYKTSPGDGIALTGNRFDRVAIDASGCLWLMSYDQSLYTFNPNDCRFVPVDMNGLKASQMQAMADGSMLVLAQGHLLRMTSEGMLDVSVSGNKPIGDVVAFCVDGAQRIWMATDERLCCHADGRLSTFARGHHFTTVAALGDHQVVCGTRDEGLYIYDRLTGAQTHYDKSVAEGMTDNHVTGIHCDSSGDIWVDTDAPGMLHMRAGTNRFETIMPTNAQGTVISSHYKSIVLEPRTAGDASLWLSPRSGGMVCYDREHGSTEVLADGDDGQWNSENNVVCAYFDHQGNLWYCVKNRGLRKVMFRRNSFELLKQQGTTLANNVRGVLQDRSGRLWVGSKDGSVAVYDERMQMMGHMSADGRIGDKNDRAYGKVYCFCQDHAGNIWIGTKGNGLFRLTPTRDALSFDVSHFTRGSDTYDLSSDDVFSLHEDSHHRLWIGTFGGGPNVLDLNHLGREQFIHSGNLLSHYPQGSCNRVRSVTTDDEGRMWICTTDGLLIGSDSSADPSRLTFSHFTRHPDDPRSLGCNDVHMVMFGREGRIFVCTNGNGLCTVDSLGDSTAVFSHYTQHEGVGSDIVFSATEDSHGNVWLVSEESLTRFTPSTGQMEIFSGEDFPQSVSFDEGHPVVTATGRLLLPTIDAGLMCFEPSAIKASSYVPRIVFTDFLQAMQHVEPSADGILKTHINNTSAIRLAHDQNSFSIEFAAIDMCTPDRIEYAYMLEGFEDKWNYSGNRRMATYTNLPKGHYRLHVRSTNGDRVWVDNTRTIDIDVRPSFWQTPWAYMLYVLALLVAIMVAAYVLSTVGRLKQKVAMEQQISDIKLKFFTSISHELRTPLTLIYGFMREIMKEPDLGETMRTRLQVVGDNAHRMLRLTNQILDIKKIESNKMKLTVRRIDLVPFVKDVMGHFLNLADEHDIDFGFKSNSDQAVIWADSDKVDQMVFNLVSNAFKYTPMGKAICVRVDEHSDHVDVSVEDQGVGISEESIKRLFVPFDNYVSDNIYNLPSSGLGLSLTKEMAELHGGTVSVKSQPGKGSTFTISMPRDREHFPPGTEFIMSDVIATTGDKGYRSLRKFHKLVENKSSMFDKNTLLIVEDNDEMRFLLESILIDDYRVIEADNGEVGLSMARQHIPDVVITDLMMPVMDGMQMLRELRNDATTSHIPVIMLTAKTDDDSIIESMEQGVDSHMSKPFNSEVLKARVRNLLEQRKRLQQAYQQRFKADATLHGDTQGRSEEPMSPGMAFAERLQALVESHIGNSDFSVEDMASQLNMSRSVLFKKLKAVTGMSPNEYLKTVRMKRAADLIKQGRHNITEITYMVGINDPHYFSNCFKKQFGMSPTDFRRSMGSD